MIKTHLEVSKTHFWRHGVLCDSCLGVTVDGEIDMLHASTIAGIPPERTEEPQESIQRLMRR